MKPFLFVLALCLAPLSSAFAESCGEAQQMSPFEVLLKKQKIAYDASLAGDIRPANAMLSCIGEGYRCSSSLDCCGSAFCNDNVCSSIGGGCRGPGARCGSSLDCCGSSFCNDGYCGDSGNSCRGEGARCGSSLDCCGSMFCRDGYCK